MQTARRLWRWLDRLTWRSLALALALTFALWLALAWHAGCLMVQVSSGWVLACRAGGAQVWPWPGGWRWHWWDGRDLPFVPYPWEPGQV
jgi:hypothetical protein